MSAGETVRELAEALVKQLIALGVGGCTCGVKSPQAHWHEPNCTFRRAEEALENAEAIRALAAAPTSPNAPAIDIVDFKEPFEIATIEQPFEVDPIALAAAWKVVKDARPRLKFGPGPMFVEAIAAYMASVKSRQVAFYEAAVGGRFYDPKDFREDYPGLVETPAPVYEGWAFPTDCVRVDTEDSKIAALYRADARHRRMLAFIERHGLLKDYAAEEDKWEMQEYA